MGSGETRPRGKLVEGLSGGKMWHYSACLVALRSQPEVIKEHILRATVYANIWHVH